MNKTQKYFLLLFTILIIILSAHLFYPKWQKSGSEATISWDVFGYYLYTPALFIYNDIEKLDFVESINQKYSPAGNNYQLTTLENGNSTGQYSLGWSIFYLPAFAIGHLSAAILDYPQDGFSLPYQMAISFYGIIFSIIGLLLTYRNLRNYFEFKESYISIILVLLGTNALNYFAIDTAHTHSALFFLYSLLIYLTISWHKTSNSITSIAIGLTLGLMCIMRPTEVIAISIPLFWEVYNKQSFKTKFSLFQKNKLQLLIAILSFCFFPIIQIVYWKLITDNFIFYSYIGQTFSWLHPHILSVLFSFRKGWFIYSPLAILFFIGAPLLYKKNKHIFFIIAGFCILNFYIVASWDIWWYGGSLGQRALVQSYAVMIFALAALVHFVLKNKILKGLLLLFSLFTIIHNLAFHYKAHSKAPFEAEAMTKAFFKKTYFKFNPNEEWYKLLDTNYIYEKEIKKGKDVIIKNTFLTITETQSNSDTIFYKTEKNYSNLRVEFTAISPYINSYFWSMPQINIIELDENDNIINTNFLRVHRFMQPNEIRNLHLDVQLKNETNKIKCFISSPNAQNKLDVEIKSLIFFTE